MNVKFSKYQKQSSEAVLWKGVLNIFARFIEKYQNIRDAVLKGNAQFIFLCNSQNHRLMFFSWKMLKSTVTKKVIVCFYNFRWRKFLKAAAYVIFLTSIMPLFEIYQRLKGVIANITDEWQVKCRRMRDECRRVKTSEDEWETSTDE